MIVSPVVTGIICIVIAYLVGSFPSAYLVVRLLTGQDIRRLGSGNVGANNTYGQAGLAAATIVALLDVGKGAGAVGIAAWLLGMPVGEPDVYLLLAALAAISGHMWSAYIGLKGGNGLGPTIGCLAVLLPWELLIVIGLLLLFTLLTHNLVFSVNLALFSVPVTSWLLEGNLLYVGFSLILMALLIVNFLPTARLALARAGSKRQLLNELLRRDRRGPRPTGTA